MVYNNHKNQGKPVQKLISALAMRNFLPTMQQIAP